MRIQTAALIVILLLVSGCSTAQTPKMTDDQGGERIIYEKNGTLIDPDQIIPDSMKPGMNWLKENTPQDAVIMSWWDYGHAIRAYAQREPVVDAPSRESLTTTVSKYLGKDPSEIDCDDCVAHEMLQEIAELLLTESDTGALELMKKYGASYLYVHEEDMDKASAMFIILGEEQRPLENTILGRALAGEPIEGLELAYRDDVCAIYSMRS